MSIKNLTVSDVGSFSKELKDELLEYARAKIESDDYFRKYRKKQITGALLLFAFLFGPYFMKHAFKEAYVLVPQLKYLGVGFWLVGALIFIVMIMTHWLANVKLRKQAIRDKANYLLESHSLVVDAIPPEELWAALSNEKTTTIS